MPEAAIPSADAAASPAQSAKNPRKAPRRATAPAGAPAKGLTTPASLLVIGADGMMISAGSSPSTAASHDAGASPIAGAATEPVAGAAVPPVDEAGAPPLAGGESSAATSDAPEPEVAAPTDAESIAAEMTLLSRRERRLAEQNLTPGLELGPTAPEMAAADFIAVESTALESTPGQAAGRTSPKKRSRLTSFARGLLYMLVISALVVGLGTVLSGKEEAAVGPSQTELHRQIAWEKTITLVAQTTALARSSGDVQVQEILHQTTKELQAQAEALDDGLPPNTAAPTPEGATLKPVTVRELILGLTSNGDELLGNALSADHSLGRVFAAVGTSQLLQGRSLSTAVGSTAPASRFLPAQVNFPAPVGPRCNSTLEPRPGVTVDSALRAAALGEQKAVYAYQVATTRLVEPQFSMSAQLLARHQRKLEVLNNELQVRCLPLATPVAGFALDASFTATPGQALTKVEAELAVIYADLAALSTAPAQDSTNTPSVSGAAMAPAGSATSQQPANITSLRKISVTWLLDSSASQAFWGGTVGALAGMAAPSPSAPPALAPVPATVSTPTNP